MDKFSKIFLHIILKNSNIVVFPTPNKNLHQNI